MPVEPEEIQDEIVRINTDARQLYLPIALLIPNIAAALGFLKSFRTVRLPDRKPSSAAESLVAG